MLFIINTHQGRFSIFLLIKIIATSAIHNEKKKTKSEQVFKSTPFNNNTEIKRQ